MNITAKIVKVSSKRNTFVKVQFTFGEGLFAPTKFGWGWISDAKPVGHTESIDMEQFSQFTFEKVELADGKVANQFRF